MSHRPGRGHGNPADDLAIARFWGAAGLLTRLQDAEVTRARLAAAVAASGLASLLSSLGMAPGAAVALVRATRPGAIETPDQLAFVHHGPSLLLPG